MKPIKGVDPSKTDEREFAEAMEYMVEYMTRYIRNNVIGGLHVSTVEKFSDDAKLIKDAKQVGNYARVFLTLNARAERKLLKRFSNKRLEKLAAKILGRVNRRNEKVFYKNVEKAIGIDRAEIMRDGPTINALILETAQWAKKLRDETLENYTANTLRVMSQGGSLSDVLEQFNGMEEKRKNHAKMVARTQVANFNSLVSKARAQNLGITRARWITSNDERVRGRPGGKYPDAKTNHWKLDGKEFDINKGVEVNGRTLLPGTDYNCRCTYEFILPDEDEQP